MPKAKITSVLLVILMLTAGMACVSRNGKAENSGSNPTNNTSMNEKVNSFYTSGDFVEVTFSISPMIFRLAVDRPDFPEVMAVIAKSYRDGTDVNYTAKGETLDKVTAE